MERAHHRRWHPIVVDDAGGGSGWTVGGEAPEGGTRVLFDLVGWKDAEEMVRIVTFGWVQMFLRLKAVAESGQPQPVFDF